MLRGVRPVLLASARTLRHRCQNQPAHLQQWPSLHPRFSSNPSQSTPQKLATYTSKVSSRFASVSLPLVPSRFSASPAISATALVTLPSTPCRPPAFNPPPTLRVIRSIGRVLSM